MYTNLYNYAVFVNSRWINDQMNIYAMHFILSDLLSENFVRYKFFIIIYSIYTTES